MTQRKDKPKVIVESFDDERIRAFLDVVPYGDLSRDYCALEKAYRSMNANNFATFVRFFVEAGMDINAVNGEGKTFLDVISAHRHAGEYCRALKDAGARSAG
jgi:hypothetical protein